MKMSNVWARSQMEDCNNMLLEAKHGLATCIAKLKCLGADEFVEVKIEVQRAIDGQRGVVQMFKTLANAWNAEYEHVSKLLDGEASNIHKIKLNEFCKITLKWCPNICQKVPEWFVEIIIEHPYSFPTCNHN